MRLRDSQNEIIRLLRLRGPMTVDELSAALGISGVAVRNHLEGLEADGLLTSHTERLPRGRPRRLFQLAEAADELFPKNYLALAQTILEHLETHDGPEKVEEVFAARRLRMDREMRPRLQDRDLEGRVAALAELQDRAGYMAEWEKDEDGSFLLREFNCAVCKIARRFPQACANELQLFLDLTEADVTREEHMASGDRSCTYRIRPRR
jgi:predicted ArsR family transcriptional regulator